MLQYIFICPYVIILYYIFILVWPILKKKTRKNMKCVYMTTRKVIQYYPKHSCTATQPYHYYYYYYHQPDKTCQSQTSHCWDLIITMCCFEWRDWLFIYLFFVFLFFYAGDQTAEPVELNKDANLNTVHIYSKTSCDNDNINKDNCINVSVMSCVFSLRLT